MVATVIEMTKVCKSYGQHQVLHDFDFYLPEGNIYSLLGSSGSGKTTILSLMVGLTRANQGTIKVFDKPPGNKTNGIPGPRLGFMPQDLGLHREFTIQETFRYFGRIYGMSVESIRIQSTFLRAFLELPKPNHMVANCSGGQKRRLSLAVALMHYPDLMVLDEPTVGLDPILRQKIWKYLKSLALNHMKTILVTTHFVEETSFATKIGFLRQGKLLTEDSPVNLLNRYQVDTIEKLYLKLSLEPSIMVFRPQIQPTSIMERYKVNQKILNYKNKSAHWRKISALVAMNFIKIRRNPSFLLLMVLLPILEVTVFCNTIGHEPKNLAWGVINKEENCTDFENTTQCGFQSISCAIQQQLQQNEMFDIQNYWNETEISQDLQNGQVWGYLKFPQNFSSALSTRITKQLEIQPNILNQSIIQIHLDTSSYPTTVSITNTFLTEVRTFLKDFAVRCDMPEYLVSLPYTLEDPVTKIDTSDFRTFMAPGIMIVLIFFLSVTLTGDTFIAGKQDGTFLRSWAAGVHYMQIIIAFLASNLLMILIQSLITLIFMYVIYQVPLHGHLAWILLILILQGFAGMCFGFFLAAAFSNHASYVHAAIGCFFPIFTLSGSFWPLQGVPDYLQMVAWYLPCTYSIQGVRDLMTKGWSLSVQWAFLTTLIWIFVFILLTIIAIKIRSPK